jgi:hypothetical protein
VLKQNGIKQIGIKQGIHVLEYSAIIVMFKKQNFNSLLVVDKIQMFSTGDTFLL